MASAELLKMTHSVDGNVQDARADVRDVGNKVERVEGKVQDVRSDVHDVGDKVEGKMQTIGNTISSGVQRVDDKLEQVNSSLSL